MSKIPKIKNGYNRQWVHCTIKGCNQIAYYDYIPYSLSNSIKLMPCKHLFSDAKEITADMALIKLNNI